MKNLNKSIENFEKTLLNAASYSGNEEKNLKIFSASMLGNDMLQNYLKIKYGKADEQKKFEANTFGSIYQLGVDSAFSNNSDFISAKRIKIKLDNGWTISGEIDQIDTVNNVIYDNKVTTSTAINSIKKEGKNHHYALQLAVYNMLMFEKTGENYDCVLAVVDKGFSYFKNNKNNNLEFIKLDIYSPKETKQKLIDATNELSTYIDNNIEPDRCENLFKYKQKDGTVKNMKCLHYCGFASVCKHYSDIEKINELMGL